MTLYRSGPIAVTGCVLGYFAWRLGQVLPPHVEGVILDESWTRLTAALFTTEAEIRAAVRTVIQSKWNEVLKPAILGPNNAYAFRDDQVLTPQEIDLIRSRIAQYNTYIDGVVQANGFVSFDVAGIFDQAASPQGFTVRDWQGAAVDTLRTTYRGKLFSLDGAHPGSYGHLVLAGELMEALRSFAAARADGRVGGVHHHDLSRVHRTLLLQVRDAEDEAIKGAQRNP